jgi:hypothetical protein
MITTHKEEVTVLDAIQVLIGPTPEEMGIIEETIGILGLRNFLLDLESYDLSEITKEKLLDLRNIGEEFTHHLPRNELNQGGGELG